MVVRRVAVLSAWVCLFATVVTLTCWMLLRGPSGTGAEATARASSASPSSPRTPSGSRSSGRQERARVVLASWEARRAAAWADGDEGALRALYAPGSRTGRLDVRMLRRWIARDLRVTAMTTQVHALQVLSASPGRWRLQVTDRLVGAVAVGAGSRHPLPSDGWTERTLELRRAGRGWQLVEARRSASP